MLLVDMLALLAGLPWPVVVKMSRYALEIAPMASLELQSLGLGVLSPAGGGSMSMVADSFRLFM